MMQDHIMCYDQGSVRLLTIAGDVRNNYTELQSIFWFQAFPYYMPIKREYTSERTLFQFEYPEVLHLCHERNIECMWVYCANAYDTEILERAGVNYFTHDVLHFVDKKSAMMFKLSRE